MKMQNLSKGSQVTRRTATGTVTASPEVWIAAEMDSLRSPGSSVSMVFRQFGLAAGDIVPIGRRHHDQPRRPLCK